MGINVDVISCTFVDYKMEFQGNGFKELTKDGTYKNHATTNRLTVFNSKFVGVNKELSFSVHVSNGHANIKSTQLEKAYQSTPVLLVTDGSRIVLSNCTFENNRIQKGTAAVAIYGSSAIVNHCVFTNNVGF